MKKRVCVAFGTRPEASKMAPVLFAIDAHPELEPVILITGQHREQLNEMLDIFGLVPDADLAVMVANQTLPDLAARIIPAAAQYFRREQPDFVLVHGDTATTFAVAFAAFLEGIPVGHVEAGLRSFDLRQPFPEEANRRLTSVVSVLDLAPTSWAKQNLLREGKSSEDIFVTGNTAVDAVRFAQERAQLPPHIPSDEPIVAVTMHRRENLPVMRRLAASLAQVAHAFPDHVFVYPMHLNPDVRDAVEPELASVDNFILGEPMDYLSMVALLAKSELIITDSGGIQEEGAALGVPVAVLRNLTERPEGVTAGVLELVGNEPETVRARLTSLLGDDVRRKAMRERENPYGDGLAGVRIADAVAWKLGVGPRPEEWQYASGSSDAAAK